MNTGEAIRAVRDALGESQQTFSNRVRSTLMTVSKWERNIYTPEADKLAAIGRLARDLKLADAAEVLDREAGLQFRMFGADMLRTIYTLFGNINADIAQASANPALSDEQRRERLAHAAVTTLQGQAITRDLMAMAPHVGPKT